MISDDSVDHAPDTFPRRRLLRDGAALTGGAIALTLASPASALAARHTQVMPAWMAAHVQATPVDIEAYEPVALTIGELETLKAASDRLIPSDEAGPGAVDAGVFVYIDRSLARYYQNQLELYQRGLAALDSGAESGGFASAPVDQQDAILTQAEAGQLEGAPEGFFATLLEHTRQGMFSDPIYGGNKDFAGWDLLRYPGIKLVWTSEEQDFNAEIEPLHQSVAEFGGSPL